MWKIALRIALALATFSLGMFLNAARTWLTNEAEPSAIQPVLVLGHQVANPIDSELLAIFGEYAAAQTRHDRAFFERVEDEQFILFQAHGPQLSRDQDIRALQAAPKDIVYKLDLENVELYGDAATVSGIMTAEYGEGEVSSWRWLSVCVKRNGEWRILSTTQLAEV